MFVEHQMIVPGSMEERHYQTAIAETASGGSTLVVLPTGLGKTIIAALVIAETLRTKRGKILFLAPTKPLVEQHARFIRKHLVAEPPAVFTGEMAPAKRSELWASSQIVAATPQVVSNDIVSGQIDLREVSLIVFDEAHRAVGDYAYVFIGKRYQAVNGGLCLGMTASPGNDPAKILEVCANLGIRSVEIRHEYDPDVVDYVHDIQLRWMEVEVPEQLRKVIDQLRKALDEQVAKLRRAGYIRSSGFVSTKDLLAAQRTIRAQLQVANKSASAFQAATTVAIAMKVSHALELAETQGVAAIQAYLDRLVKDAGSKGASRAAKDAIALPKVQTAMIEVRKLEAAKVESPKLMRVKKLVVAQLNQKPDSRIIVFTHYRDTCETVAEELARISIIRPVRFVGQATKGDDKGMNQKRQVEIIDKFQAGEFNVLVATSVAEEGLDIPSTDLVVFYEPVPSEIRSIQRRGRTGRHRSGKVVILISKGTRDEAYYWSSKHKEGRMHRELEKLRKDLQKDLQVGRPSGQAFARAADIHAAGGQGAGQAHDAAEEKGQRTLVEFDGKTPAAERMRIIADSREFKSSVVKHLATKDVIVEPKQLDVGDYVVSERVGIERKEAEDLIASIMDGRLFQQVKALKRAYQSPLIIIEGRDIYTRRLSPEAVRGALAAIAVDFGVPIMLTDDDKDTAEFLFSLVKRELAEGRRPGIRGEKGAMLMEERQQFILEGFPNISGVIAQRLLSHFGSVKAVLEASEEDLQEVKGVGKVIARGIREVLESRYHSKEKGEG